VAATYAERGLAVSPERIVLTASTSEACSLVLKLLCDPGDVVLVPRPSYPLFEHLAALEGAGTASYPIAYTPSEGWRLDADAMDAVLAPRARAVIAVSPNNPTGSYLRPSEWERLAATCATRGMAVIVDEVFHDHRSASFEGPAAEPLAGGPALTFVLSGLSKVAGLPQMKLGWIAVSGPAPLAAEALHRLEFIADAYLSVGAPVMAAAPGLLAGRHAFRERVHERVEANEARLRGEIGGGPLGLRAREGGWSAVLDLASGADEEAFVLGLLEAEGVLVHPGYFYDVEEEGVLVMSLLPPPEDVARGARALCRRAGGS
jgi:aspartate/methionine/tyrosine aminotransferase